MDFRVLASNKKEVNLLSMKSEYIKTCDFINGLLKIQGCFINVTSWNTKKYFSLTGQRTIPYETTGIIIEKTT